MTDVEALLAEVRERHTVRIGRKNRLYCNACIGPYDSYLDWPCDAIRLADALEALRDEMKGRE